jgi:hypothetical protein
MLSLDFETALSLLENQSSVSTDTVLMIKNLYQSLQAANHQPASMCHPRPVSSDSQSCSAESSDLEASSASSENTCDTSKAVEKRFKPASSKRQQLTSREAAEIFELRPRSKAGKALRRGSMLLCKTIAPKYGVSAKTIRDIWRGRTWLHATEHLWTEDDKRHNISSRSLVPHSQIAEPEAELRGHQESLQRSTDLSSMRSLAGSGPCNHHLQAMNDLQRGSQCFQAPQPSLNAGCLPASHLYHPNAAPPSPASWASITLQQLALRQCMQGCAAHSLNLAPPAPAVAVSNPPFFDPALLRQLCSPAGVGVGGVCTGPLLTTGVAAGLPFAPLHPAYVGAAGLGSVHRGSWGM